MRAEGAGRRRVALLLPNFAGGGAERVALAQIEALHRQGHDIDLVLVDKVGDLLSLLPNGVNVVNLGASRMRAAIRPLACYLRERRPDALHAAMWPITIVAVIAHRLARSRARLVVSDQVALSKQYDQPLMRTAVGLSVRLLYPLADHRVMCSAEAAADLHQLSGLPRESIEVIRNPIMPPARMPSGEAVDARWGGSGSRIITVGSLKHQKNHALLLRAFALLRRVRDARLMILGEGALRPELEALAADLGVAEAVVMPGFALDPWPYYASADLFVLSSDYEGLPLVLAEAMRAGLRVVSTDCRSGPRELLDDGRYGRLVPCGDAEALAAAMSVALDEPADPDRMRRRSEEVAGPRGIDRYVALMLGTDANEDDRG